MKSQITIRTFIGVVLIGAASISHSAPINMQFTATVIEATGTYDSMSTNDEILGTIIYDTDEGVATDAVTEPGVEPGHEYTSRYTLPASPYSFSVSNSAAAFSFTNTVPNGSPLEVLVNNDLALTADETGGLISDGSYDWLEILGSTASDVAGPYTPGNGEEWTLALIADDNSWFTDGSVMPDFLPSSYTAILVGLDLNSNGDEIGTVFASVGPLTLSPVPIPAAGWLFGTALIGLAGIKRKK